MNVMKSLWLAGAAPALLAIGCGGNPETVGGTEPETKAEAVLRDSLGRPLAPISAAIVRANLETDATMNLVARIEVQPNELVEFYEPGPGLVMVMGAGAPAAPPIGERTAEKHSEDPAAIWAVLTENAPMPEALEQALSRAATRAPASAAPSQRQLELPAFVAASPDPLAPSRDRAGDLKETAHLTSDWCDSAYYDTYIPEYGYNLSSCGAGYHNFVQCLDHRTGNMWVSHNDTRDTKSNVCPYRGNVTFKVDADEDWIQEGSWTVNQNTYRWKSTRDNGCDIDPFNDCPYVRVDILNASGDGYQFRYLAKGS